jgi:hypothetical protein
MHLRWVCIAAAALAAAPTLATDPDPAPLPCASAASPSTASGPFGELRFVVPAGMTPQIGPIEIADGLKAGFHLHRAGGSVTEIVCMELAAPTSNGSAASAWRVHAKGSFWLHGPPGGASCSSDEAVLSIAENGEAGGIGLRGARCRDGERLTKGR